MKTYIALLRGINVGGNHSLPMKSLKSLLEDLGARDARTYIQSGNAAFEASASDAKSLAERLSSAIETAHGFRPRVWLLERSELARAAEENPFPEAVAEPKSLHLGFLLSEPKKPDIAGIEALQAQSERCRLIGKTFFLHAPDGIGRSKLAEKMERLLGEPMTARNWRTVEKILELAGQAGPERG